VSANGAGAGRPFDAVVFDFGGVLIRPITNKIGVLADRAGVEVEELVEVLMGPLGESTDHHPWHRAERGEIGVHDLQDRVAPYAEARGVELHGDEIAFLFEVDFTVIRPVVERVAALRDEGYRTGLLTNSFEYFRATLEELLDMQIFDVVVDSSEVGHRKPEPAIYELMAARLGVEPARIVFLDDFGPNVTGARTAGWTAIHVTDPLEALDQLNRTLIR
jgi:epoxide hydrolase-like predicted phosphatase